MNQRLVWNFELSVQKTLPLSNLVDNEHDNLKWEQRFFWSDEQIIKLLAIDNTLLDIANYHQKHKEDYYYLSPYDDYNIKRRRNELLYKPLILKKGSSFGFGAKINIDDEQNLIALPPNVRTDLQIIAQNAREHGIVVFVKKEEFVYKFHTTPPIKLSLDRLEVNNQVYFSICIEGKSRTLVEKISEHLLGEQVSCEYVTFLKKIMKL